MTEIIIARLERASLPVVAELNELLGQLSPQFMPQTVENLSRILDSPTTVFVASDEGKIVGVVSVSVAAHLMGTRAWIEDVVVDGAYRGQGIARRLLERVIEHGVAQGCMTFKLTSGPARVGARKLYEAMGFEAVETGVYCLKR